MNNDLISREALKEKWKEECCGCCENCSHCMTGLNCELIDNAPTVDRVINVYPKGEVIVQEKRPEARWIKNKAANLDELGYVLCSNCRCGFKRYDRGTRKSDLPWIDGQAYELENRCNYCPTCGAKMLNANGPTEEK